jgi:hypothetical protein
VTDQTFVCEGCGKVFPEACPTCQGADGATVATIKQALRDCPKIADVNDTARHFGRHVAILDQEGGDARTAAIEIKNLASYRRWLMGYKK